MKLSKDDQERVVDWLKEKCGVMRCKCCGNANWTAIEIPTIALGFNVRTTRFHYSDGIPMVHVACSTCGNVLSFSAKVIGLEPDKPKEEKTEK